MTSQRRKVKNYLLNRSYQLRYTLTMVLVGAILTAGLGTFWYAEVRETSRIIEVKGLVTMSNAEVDQLREDLTRSDRQRLAILVGFGVAFAVLLAGYGILLTHRVAGPLYKIERAMVDVAEGRLSTLRDLRRKDQLQHFWGTFRQMHDALREQAERDAALYAEAIETMQQCANLQSVEDAANTRELVARLRQQQLEKNAALKRQALAPMDTEELESHLGSAS